MNNKNSSVPVQKSGFTSMLDLVKVLSQFSSIERRVSRGEMRRPENDVEHSYDLAMMAWTIVVNDQLPLNLEKVLKFALVHDLVEVYAGDACALDDKGLATKEARERAAAAKIAKTPSISHFFSAIEKYEARTSEEAKFVYALDKIMPALQVIVGQQTVWKDNNLTRRAWEDIFVDKMKTSKYLHPYLDQLLALLDQNSHLFAGGR